MTKDKQIPEEDQSFSETGPCKRQSRSDSEPTTPPEVRIGEWEVWHTYATYLCVTRVDLDTAARSLVEAGIATCAMLQNGRTYWTSGTKVCSGNTMVDLEESTGTAVFNIEADPGCSETLGGFAAEAWFQAGYFRSAEMRVFGADGYLPPPYVRAFLGQLRLVSSDKPKSTIYLYPTLILYESGVMVLEFRTISPDSPVHLREFIVGSVNLFQFPFDRVEASPALVRLAPPAYSHSLRNRSILSRWKLVRLQRGHDTVVRQLTRQRAGGDFVFDLVPLTQGEGLEDAERLHTLARTVLHTVAFAIGQPRSGLSLLLRGQKPTPELGGFWSSRPHIHIVRFDGQCETASENERQHEAVFRNMLLRIPASDSAISRQRLPKDRRLFDDYNAYITRAATLWVWSKRGIDQQSASADANRGHLIYEHQAIVELLEYGCMLHHSLLDRASNYDILDEAFAAQHALIKLRKAMTFSSHSGEIMDLLDHGWKEFKVPELGRQISDALRLRQEETSTSESRTRARTGNLLTILFGLLAIPPLAERVVEPAWEWLHVLRPSTDVAFQMLTNVVSFAIVMPLVLWLMRPRSFERRRARRASG